MKSSVKAALYSGLVFPGVGQLIVLKRYVRGAALMIVSLACVVLLGVRLVHVATSAADQLLSSGDEIDVTAITDATDHASNAMSGPLSTVATGLLIACWVGGVADALWPVKRPESDADKHVAVTPNE